MNGIVGSSPGSLGQPPLPLALLLVLLLALPVAAALAAKAMHAAGQTTAAKQRRYARTMLVLWSMTGLAVYALRLHSQLPADVGVRLPRHAWQLFAGIAVVVGLLGLSGAWRDDISPAYAQSVRAVLPVSRSDWLWFVPVAASAAVCEEFLYRGYAITQLWMLTGSLTLAVCASTLAFGFAHAYQGRFGMLGTAFTGLVYAGIFLWSGSLLPCMLAHFAQDLAGGVLLSRRLGGESSALSAAVRRQR
jgi:membrane protease YdiL (CAAX protease family)